MTRADLLALGANLAKLRDERAWLLSLLRSAEQRVADAEIEIEEAKRVEQAVAPRPVELDVRAVRRAT